MSKKKLAAHAYPEVVQKLLKKITIQNLAKIKKAATLMRETVDGGGVIFVFGTGHSSLFAEEAFHRAGGLIPVSPILYDFLTPHVSPKISGKLERLAGIASVLFARSGIKKGDLMWIASQSGVNTVIVEMALECKKAGIPTIALTSLEHSKKVLSRQASKRKLFEICDLVFDNYCPTGDALMKIQGVQVAAGSNLANSFIYHWVLTETCMLWASSGKKLPIYRSTNTPGGDIYNEKQESKFRSRIPLL